MGVKSLWRLLEPVGRPVLCVVPSLRGESILDASQARDNGGQVYGYRL